MINAFLKDLLSIKGQSQHTAAAYSRDLRQFVAFIKQNYPTASWRTITRGMIEHYIMSLVSYGELPTTTNRKLSAISAIYRYFIRQGHDITNPAQYVCRRKIADTIPNTIDPDQLRTAYENTIGTARIMLGLLITTGIRLGELLAIRWGDINLKENTIIIRGKGNKQRIVSVPSRQLEEIRYAAPRQNAEDTLFHTSQFETRCMIYQALTPYCHARQLSPHAIRHTFATQMAKAGASAPTIAQALGHSNLKSTQHYVDNAQAPSAFNHQYIKLN